MTKMTWAAWLKAKLKERNWTRLDLVVICGGAITESAISRQISDPKRVPRRATRERIEQAIGQKYSEREG